MAAGDNTELINLKIKELLAFQFNFIAQMYHLVNVLESKPTLEEPSDKERELYRLYKNDAQGYADYMYGQYKKLCVEKKHDSLDKLKQLLVALYDLDYSNSEKSDETKRKSSWPSASSRSSQAGILNGALNQSKVSQVYSLIDSIISDTEVKKSLKTEITKEHSSVITGYAGIVKEEVVKLLNGNSQNIDVNVDHIAGLYTEADSLNKNYWLLLRSTLYSSLPTSHQHKPIDSTGNTRQQKENCQPGIYALQAFMRCTMFGEEFRKQLNKLAVKDPKLDKLANSLLGLKIIAELTKAKEHLMENGVSLAIFIIAESGDSKVELPVNDYLAKTCNVEGDMDVTEKIELDMESFKNLYLSSFLFVEEYLNIKEEKNDFSDEVSELMFSNFNSFNSLVGYDTYVTYCDANIGTVDKPKPRVDDDEKKPYSEYLKGLYTGFSKSGSDIDKKEYETICDIIADAFVIAKHECKNKNKNKNEEEAKKPEIDAKKARELLEVAVKNEFDSYSYPDKLPSYERAIKIATLISKNDVRMPQAYKRLLYLATLIAAPKKQGIILNLDFPPHIINRLKRNITPENLEKLTDIAFKKLVDSSLRKGIPLIRQDYSLSKKYTDTGSIFSEMITIEADTKIKLSQERWDKVKEQVRTIVAGAKEKDGAGDKDNVDISNQPEDTTNPARFTVQEEDESIEIKDSNFPDFDFVVKMERDEYSFPKMQMSKEFIKRSEDDDVSADLLKDMLMAFEGLGPDMVVTFNNCKDTPEVMGVIRKHAAKLSIAVEFDWASLRAEAWMNAKKSISRKRKRSDSTDSSPSH